MPDMKARDPDRAPMAMGVEDNPLPTSQDAVRALLRPTTRKGGPLATLQSRSTAREASAPSRQGCPVGIVTMLESRAER